MTEANDKEAGQLPPIKKEMDDMSLEEHERPQNFALWRKWLAVLVISAASLFITCASTLSASAEVGMAEELNVGHIVSILPTSLFVLGLGIGPLIVGPLSEVYGRNPVYRISFTVFFLLSFPVAFAPHIAVMLIFRFFTGFCGAAFLSVVGGSVSDLFADEVVASPMAIFSVSTFLGPVIGPIIGGFINQHLDWRWTYYLIICWSFGQLLALLLFVPETYAPVLVQKKARISAGETGQAIVKSDWREIRQAILLSCYTPFKLILLDRMALLLDVWSALVLGILYLAFEVYPIIFARGHGFNQQETGLGFLGVGVGLVLALATQPLWNRYMASIGKKNGGQLPPEPRLYMGQVGAICTPIGLFWLAFTTYPSVHWIVPIIASIPFGAGVYFVYTAVYTYLVTTYRPIAASALAANGAMRATFAAAFPLFAGAMYNGLGTVGATALLAGLTTIMAPLPFVLVKIGPRLRSQSRFAI